MVLLLAAASMQSPLLVFIVAVAVAVAVVVVAVPCLSALTFSFLT